MSTAEIPNNNLGEVTIKNSENYDKEYLKEVATQAAYALGGLGRIKTFTGAGNFYYLECNGMPALQMSMEENDLDADFLFVCLNIGTDLYELIFTKIPSIIVHHQKDIYVEDLMDMFEQTTGLFLTFHPRG